MNSNDEEIKGLYEIEENSSFIDSISNKNVNDKEKRKRKLVNNGKDKSTIKKQIKINNKISKLKNNKLNIENNLNSNINDFFEEEAEESDESESDFDEIEHQKLINQYRKKSNNDFFSKIVNKNDNELEIEYEEKAKEYLLNSENEFQDDLFPTLKDPKIFSVKCKPGFERESVFSLISKIHDKNYNYKDLIFSASSFDKISGWIFIESNQEINVKKICQGLLVLNSDYIKMIPTKEVPNLYQTNFKNSEIFEFGDFVRIKRGLYENDLCLVEKMDDDTNGLILRLIPRLSQDNKKSSKDNLFRPNAKLFSIDDYKEAKQINGYGTKLNSYIYKNLRFENGFLIKKFLLSNIEIKGINPTFEEVQIFLLNEPNKDFKEKIYKKLSLISESNRKHNQNFDKGENIKIINGEFIGLEGKIIDIINDTIKINLNNNNMLEPIILNISEIIKIFNIGDMVEIISGKNLGFIGNIIKIENDFVTIISEDNKEEVLALFSDIKKGKYFSKKNNLKNIIDFSLSKFDMVSLNDGKTIGLIISIINDFVTIIDIDGFINNISKTKIEKKINKNLNTTNCYNQNIHSKCTIKILTGSNKDCLGLVIALYHSRIFIYDNKKKLNGGILVEDANNCYLLESQVYDNSRNIARFNNPLVSSLANDKYEEKDKFILNKETTRKTNFSTKVGLIGQRKKIIKGEYKGWEGVIQSICDNKVRFELSAKNKVINIPLDFLNMNADEREFLIKNNISLIKNTLEKSGNYIDFNKDFLSTPIYNPNSLQ